ncbi:hypothetical protein AMTRI_Chr11g99760 [Amborella trichopoda]
MVGMVAMHCIDESERGDATTHPTILELAKLNFNMVQSQHKRDLKEVTRWWNNLGLVDKLTFARDRLVECFIIASVIGYELEFSRCRKEITKVYTLLTVIDDVYDVYGSLDELELFTKAVDRWDLKAMDTLPEYMKICYLALYNTAKQMAYDTLKETGWDIKNYLRHVWGGLCKAYLQEAEWFHTGHRPTLEQYLRNGWTSISGPVVLFHAYFFIVKEFKIEAVNCLENESSIVYWSSMIQRLCNDMGTSKEDRNSVILCHCQSFWPELGLISDEPVGR